MTEFEVIEEVGAATNSNVVEVTVDLAALVQNSGVAGTISKEEAMSCLDLIKNHILSGIWPPA